MQDDQFFSPPPMNDKEVRVANKLQHVPGLVLAHGTGSGKTRTSMQVAEQTGLNTDVVTPAALQGNYKKELLKWYGQVPDNFQIESQQTAAKNGLKHDTRGGMLVVDEAHKARDPKSHLLEALKNSEAKKRLLLTATPVYNHPADIAPLINVAADRDVLPEDRTAFSKKFIKDNAVRPSLFGMMMGVKPGTDEQLQDIQPLRNALKSYVDFEPGKTEGFPEHHEEIIKTPLSQSQQDIYKTIMGRAPMWVRWKVKHGLPPNKPELRTLQAFLTGARQVANSNYDFIQDKNKVESPKIDAAVKYLAQHIAQNPRYKGVVYSNYLGSGLMPYKHQLDQQHIPYGEFSGEIGPAQREQLVKDYNADKLKALLISSAGAEGLDLKGTRLLQILEPHFNREKEKQVIGRAIRYQSHAGLPQDEQNVTVQRYLSQPQGSWMDKMMGKPVVPGTDEYISNMADKKDRLNQQMMDMIAKYST